MATLGNRLVDYFVVMGIKDAPDAFPSIMNDISQYQTSQEVTKFNLSFKASIVDRWPLQDFEGSSISPELPMFCLPEGVQVSKTCPLPQFYTFALTSGNGTRVYAANLLFFENLLPEVDEKIEEAVEEFKQRIDSSPKTGDEVDEDEDAVAEAEEHQQTLEAATISDKSTSLSSSSKETSSQEAKPSKPLYISKSFCIISDYPLFKTFKQFLMELYRLTLVPNTIPIERFIGNFIQEIPLPPQGRVSVQYTIGQQIINIQRPAINELPTADVDFEQIFQLLSLENIFTLFSCILLEKQILLISKHYSVLGTIAEVLTAIIYPFHWPHVYIPILPKACIEFIYAPVPFIMGVHTSFFDNDECPPEVVRVDLDNNTVMDGMGLQIPKLPEKPRDKLRNSLQKVFASCPVSKFNPNQVDLAFSIAPSPEESDAEVNEIKREFKTLDVRLSFLKFFVSLFQKYRHYMHRLSNVTAEIDTQQYFRTAAFIKDSVGEQGRPFLKLFFETQMWDRFVVDRLQSVKVNEITFFDEHIKLKANRSKLKLKKEPTPFLNDKSFKVNQVVPALQPNLEGLEKDRKESKQYVYTTFPKLKPELFSKPREFKLLVNEKDLIAEKARQQEMLDSWRTVLTSLNTISNQLIHHRVKTRDERPKAGKFDIKSEENAEGAAKSSTTNPPSSNTLSAHSSISIDMKDLAAEKDKMVISNLNAQFFQNEDSEDSLNTIGTQYVSKKSLLSRFNIYSKDTCPHCNTILTSSEIKRGFSGSPTEYRISCCHCHKKFVPHIVVSILEEDINAAANRSGSVISIGSSRALPSIPQRLKKALPPKPTVHKTLPPPPTTTLSNHQESVESEVNSQADVSSATASTSAVVTSPNTGEGDQVEQQPQDQDDNEGQEQISDAVVVRNGTPKSSEQDSSAKQSREEVETKPQSPTKQSKTQVVYESKYEYLSPIRLKKEVESMLSTVPNSPSAHEKFLIQHPSMFWNLVLYYRQMNIPLNFVLPQFSYMSLLKEMIFIMEVKTKEMVQ